MNNGPLDPEIALLNLTKIRKKLWKVKCMARSASLLSGLQKMEPCKLCVFVFCINVKISGNFWNFTPYKSVLGVDNRSPLIFSIPQETLPWQQIFGKIGKITIWQSGILEQLEIGQFRLNLHDTEASFMLLMRAFT